MSWRHQNGDMENLGWQLCIKFVVEIKKRTIALRHGEGKCRKKNQSLLSVPASLSKSSKKEEAAKHTKTEVKTVSSSFFKKKALYTALIKPRAYLTKTK